MYKSYKIWPSLFILILALTYTKSQQTPEPFSTITPVVVSDGADHENQKEASSDQYPTSSSSLDDASTFSYKTDSPPNRNTQAPINDAIGLIHPVFTKISIEEKPDVNQLRVNLTTRSATYALVNYNANQNQGGTLKSLTSWSEPQDILDKYSEAEKRRTMAKAKGYLQQFVEGSLQRIFVYVNAIKGFTFRGQLYKVLLRDNQLFFYKENREPHDPKNPPPIVHLSMSQLSTRLYQIYAIDALYSETEDKVILLALDAIGRIIKTEYKINESGEQFKITNIENGTSVYSLSALEVAKGDKAFLDSRLTIKDNAKEFFKRELDKKHRVNFVEAITPIGDDSGYCLSNGLWFQDLPDVNPEPRVPISCYVQGKPDFSLIPKFTSDSDIVIHAMHFGNYEGKSYYHFYFSEYPKNKQKTNIDYRYTFVQHDQVMGQTNAMYNLQGGSGATKQDSKFHLDTDKVKMVPNDLVGYNKDGCNKIIGFVDVIYSIGDINQYFSMTPATRFGFADLHFYINAAMAIGDKFIFFTHTNRIIMMTMNIPGCDISQGLVSSDVKELYSQDYMMERLFNMNAQQSEPIMYDFRELSQYGYKPSRDIALIPGANETTKSKGRDGSVLAIIVIGVIIAGLILGGLLYYLCLRNPYNDEALTKGRSKMTRKSKSAKKVNIDPNYSLHAVTVRSTSMSPSVQLPSSSGLGKGLSPTSKQAITTDTVVKSSKTGVVSSPQKSSLGKLSHGKSSPGKSSPGKLSHGKSSPGKLSHGKSSPGKLSPGKSSPGKLSQGKSSPGKSKSKLSKSPTRSPTRVTITESKTLKNVKTPGLPV